MTTTRQFTRSAGGTWYVNLWRHSQSVWTQFVRVHRSAIVNLAHVRTVHPIINTESALVLYDGTQDDR
jgi:hypothetical protein